LRLKRGQVEEFGRLALCAGRLPDRYSAIHRRCVQVLRINGIGQTKQQNYIKIQSSNLERQTIYLIIGELMYSQEIFLTGVKSQAFHNLKISTQLRPIA